MSGAAAVAHDPSSTSRMMARVLEGVVHIDVGSHSPRGVHHGAGVVWARDGRGRALIVSNAHVVTGDPVWLSGQDGRRYPAMLVAREAVRDLALVRCDDAPPEWRAVPSKRDALRVGQVVMAVGHPLGVRHAVTTGVVHACGPLQSDVALPESQRSLSWAQFDLRLAPGNSGGPVIDASGHLVGISTMIARGLGLAIPAADVDRFVFDADGPALLAHGWTRNA